MASEADDFGNPMFKADELLNTTQVKDLLSKFAYQEKVKGAKPFSCNFCDKKFPKKSMFLQHVSKAHNPEVSDKVKEYVKVG